MKIKFFSFIFFLITLNSSQGICETTTCYLFKNEPIDVVIPCIEKDIKTLDMCINAIKKYGKGIRRVYVVSSKRLSKKARWFDESYFPFTKADLAMILYSCDEATAKNKIKEPHSRVGWYFQQLLKLYAPFVIPNISSNVLVLDADTIFLRKIAFLNRKNEGLYCLGSEYHQPYFAHADRLSKGLIRRLDEKISGITHHMLFQKAVLEDLFYYVEQCHQNAFWKVFCSCIDVNEGSGASEYEIYFNFVFTRTDQVNIRQLKWKNIDSLKDIKPSQNEGFDFVSCHSWLRKVSDGFRLKREGA